MRGFIRVLLIAVVFLAVDDGEGREWVSRDGQFTVEAELLTVEAGQVVLRREGGSVIRVPLERLSLGDVKYVQEALEAAGLAVPAGSAASAENTEPTDEPAATKMEPPASKSQTAPDPEGPPLAQPGLARWQAEPDPAPQAFDLKSDAVVEIPIDSGYSRPLVLYPSSPSPFVVLGGGRNNNAQQLWDMRKGQAVGEIDVEMNENDDLALSPDGRFLAYHNYHTRGEVRIWSFADVKAAQTIKLPEHGSMRFLRFAGSQRLILADSREDAYRVYDVESGEHSVTIDLDPQHDDACQVLSPGGNYLVHFNRQLAIHDTRNGVRAGRLKTVTESHVRPTCLVFSGDGKELAGYFRDGSGLVIQVWDLSDGKSVLTQRLAEDPSRKMGYVRYHGGVLQWLADRNGWLLSGVAVVDRESGQIVWQDRQAIAGSEVLPRRIVDADRMLVFRKENNERTLRLISIPKDEIAESRALVEAGGTAADAGLPPSTKIDMQGAKKVTLAPGPWTYRAAAPTEPKVALRQRVRLANGHFDPNRAFFSSPGAARVAIGESVDVTRASWKSTSLVPQACQLIDLESGEQAGRFEVPFPTEFVDLSPDGKLGLFRIDRSKDRLDIWDLAGGQHILGFRPYEDAMSHECQVHWAGFIDENHLMTLSQRRKLVVWKLPECRAVYTSAPDLGWIAGRTRDRQTIVVMSGRTPHLVDAMSGTLVGTLPEVQTDGMVVLPQANFSHDENRLAVISHRGGGCLLAAWDLVDRSRILNLELPFKAYGVVWCGPDHVLVNRTAGSDDPDAVIDVDRGLIVWNYNVVSGTSLRSSPDGRCWFACRSHLSAPTELAAFELPGEEVKSLLSRVQLPAPLIGPSVTVTVQTQIENPPQAIPPGWANLERLDEGVYQQFSKQLEDKGVNVVARGTIRLIVGIDQKKTEETMSVGRLFGPSRRILLSATALTPYVAVLDSSGNRVWSKQPKKKELKPVDLDDCPEGMDKETYLKLQQWDNAVQWLRSVEIPYPLFHPSVHRGFGESLITPEKTQIRRSPNPAQMKPQNKTACVSAAILPSS